MARDSAYAESRKAFGDENVKFDKCGDQKMAATDTQLNKVRQACNRAQAKLDAAIVDLFLGIDKKKAARDKQAQAEAELKDEQSNLEDCQKKIPVEEERVKSELKKWGATFDKKKYSENGCSERRSSLETNTRRLTKLKRKLTPGWDTGIGIGVSYAHAVSADNKDAAYRGRGKLWAAICRIFDITWCQEQDELGGR